MDVFMPSNAPKGLWQDPQMSECACWKLPAEMMGMFLRGVMGGREGVRIQRDLMGGRSKNWLLLHFQVTAERVGEDITIQRLDIKGWGKKKSHALQRERMAHLNTLGPSSFFAITAKGFLCGTSLPCSMASTTHICIDLLGVSCRLKQSLRSCCCLCLFNKRLAQ